MTQEHNSDSTSALAGEPDPIGDHIGYADFGDDPVAGASGSTGNPVPPTHRHADGSREGYPVNTRSIGERLFEQRAFYNSDTHAIYDKSTHVAVRKMTKAEAIGHWDAGRFFVSKQDEYVDRLTDLGIVLNPITAFLARPDIQAMSKEEALREYEKECGR